MRTAKGAKGTSGNKSDGAAKDVEAYLSAVPEPARTTLEKVRATIRSVVPAEATEGLSYGMPAFRYKGALVGYAAVQGSLQLLPDECLTD